MKIRMVENVGKAQDGTGLTGAGDGDSVGTCLSLPLLFTHGSHLCFPGTLRKLPLSQCQRAKQHQQVEGGAAVKVGRDGGTEVMTGVCRCVWATVGHRCSKGKIREKSTF